MTEIFNSPAFSASKHLGNVDLVIPAAPTRTRPPRSDRTAFVYPIGMLVVSVAISGKRPRIIVRCRRSICCRRRRDPVVHGRKFRRTDQGKRGQARDRVLGFVLSVAVGVPLALAIYLWTPFHRAVLSDSGFLSGGAPKWQWTFVPGVVRLRVCPRF